MLSSGIKRERPSASLIYVIDEADSLVVVLKVARRSESTYRRVGPSP
jgi:mRNA-degrading endonuclease RelE of RelBE toxin-antitoxin system